MGKMSTSLQPHIARGRAVAPQHYQDYQEFLSDPDPFSLNSELAEVRSLAVEMRQAIEAKGAEARLDFYKRIALALCKFINKDERFDSAFQDLNEKQAYVRDMVREMIPLVRDEFEEAFGKDNTITIDQAKVMAHLSDTAGKLAERQQKLLSQRKLSVKYDDQLMATLLMFVTQVVFPNMSNMQERAALASATKLWLPAQKAQ